MALARSNLQKGMKQQKLLAVATGNLLPLTLY